MYEKFFGLRKSPFRANAKGSDVFMGPQTARTMSGFRKALAVQDAVVTVSGPAGTGKTVLVNRALDAIGMKNRTVRVGRMQMDARDVLESLLIVLGVQNRPSGTILRFTTLRRTMKELEDAEARVFIVVEDAIRTGTDVLAELEALTSAEAGESEGAGIILMGDERLAEFLKDPQLAQLRQRIRQSHKIVPLCEPELRGYLRHCFRLVGGDFDGTFDAKSLDLLHYLTGGVPRVVNNLVDAALHAAAAQEIRPVPAELIAKVATDEFGLCADDFDFSTPTPEPLPELTSEALPELEPDPVPELASEALPELEPEPLPQLDAEQPVIVFADEDAPSDDALTDGTNRIPELIQDTLPDLAILAPELATLDTAPSDDIPELQAGASDDNIPELSPEPLPLSEEAPERTADTIRTPVLSIEDDTIPAPELELDPTARSETMAEPTNAEQIPAWDRDPTMAELKPDLEALEAAMAFAHGETGPKPTLSEDAVLSELPEPEPEEPEEIPEITLDRSIRTGIEDQFSDTEVDLPQRPAAKADGELEKIASEIAKARTLEDVDDKMAETLFGAEISMIAAQVIANAPTGEPANDELEVEADAALQIATAAPGKSEEVSLETKVPKVNTGLDLSASQRLRTVRALNTGSNAVAPGMPVEPNTSVAPPPVDTPESIEDQINTSITQTLKALKVPTPPDDDHDETSKSGFFGRFRRS